MPFIRVFRLSFMRAPSSKAWDMSLVRETSYSFCQAWRVDEMRVRGEGSGLEFREPAEEASGSLVSRCADQLLIELRVADIRVTEPVVNET
jgi:hypothetical protein